MADRKFVLDDRELREMRLAYDSPPLPGGGGTPPPGGVTNSASPGTNWIDFTLAPVQFDRWYQLYSSPTVTGQYVADGPPLSSPDEYLSWSVNATNPAQFFVVREAVNPNAPTVTITSPPNGTAFVGYDDIVIRATATPHGTNLIKSAVLIHNLTNLIALPTNDTNLTDLEFRLESKYMPPGEHTFQVYAADDTECGADGVQNGGYSAPITVTVDHPAWFGVDWLPHTPETWSVMGKYISVMAGFQFGDPDIDCTIRVYDPAGHLVLEDFWGDIWESGWILAEYWFLDSNNNVVWPPEPYYDIVFSFHRQEGATEPQSAADGAELIPMDLNRRQYIEREWPSVTNSEAIIAYQPTFAEGTDPELAVEDTFKHVYEAFSAGYRFPLGSAEHPFKLLNSNNWTTLSQVIRNPTAMTLYYYGHGHPEYIGQQAKPGEYLTAARLREILGNYAPYNGGANHFPYRAVFMWGCNIGRPNGHVLEAFLGILQSGGGGQASWGDFSRRGLPPRAGFGFTDYKTKGYAGTLNGNFFTALRRLPQGWSQIENGRYLTLQQAVRHAQTTDSGAANPEMTDYRIVGDPTLRFQ